MNLPQDDFLLLSYINTQLRDNFEDIDELCSALDINKKTVSERLENIGYNYNKELNAFR